jgi:hypothetical protein
MLHMVEYRWTLCPICFDTIKFRVYRELQGEYPYIGWVESLDEVIKGCNCFLTESELDDLFFKAQFVEDG